MDRHPDEVQFIGVYGVYKEAFKIIFSWPKMFMQITVAFILPLSFIFLAYFEIWLLRFGNILLYGTHSSVLNNSNRGTHSSVLNRISHRLSSDWILFLVFEVGYLLFVFVLWLLSSSAVVYTIACIYTAKDLTFAKVLSVVPKVWKRLIITYLWNSSFIFAYIVVASLALVLTYFLLGNTSAGNLVFVFVFICFVVGLQYIYFIYYLATVVSVLEDIKGIHAMIKSKELIKGKMGVASAIYISTQLSVAVIQSVFGYVVYGTGTAWMRFGVRVGCLLVFTILILLWLVVQTVVYFICKSYHHESLSDHLEVDSGDYVPLKGRDTQLDQFDI